MFLREDSFEGSRAGSVSHRRGGLQKRTVTHNSEQELFFTEFFCGRENCSL
jgi:hypothetical protein